MHQSLIRFWLLLLVALCSAAARAGVVANPEGVAEHPISPYQLDAGQDPVRLSEFMELTRVNAAERGAVFDEICHRQGLTASRVSLEDRDGAAYLLIHGDQQDPVTSALESVSVHANILFTSELLFGLLTTNFEALAQHLQGYACVKLDELHQGLDANQNPYPYNWYFSSRFHGLRYLMVLWDDTTHKIALIRGPGIDDPAAISSAWTGAEGQWQYLFVEQPDGTLLPSEKYGVFYPLRLSDDDPRGGTAPFVYSVIYGTTGLPVRLVARATLPPYGPYGYYCFGSDCRSIEGVHPLDLSPEAIDQLLSLLLPQSEVKALVANEAQDEVAFAAEQAAAAAQRAKQRAFKQTCLGRAVALSETHLLDSHLCEKTWDMIGELDVDDSVIVRGAGSCYRNSDGALQKMALRVNLTLEDGPNCGWHIDNVASD